MNTISKRIPLSNFSLFIILSLTFVLHFDLFALFHNRALPLISLLIQVLYLVGSMHLILNELKAPTLKSKVISVIFYCTYGLFSLAVLSLLAFFMPILLLVAAI